MAYRTRRRVARRGSYRATSRSRYGTPKRRTRRMSRRRTGASRVIIQVVGAPGAGVPVSAVTLGKKSARVVRARY